MKRWMFASMLGACLATAAQGSIVRSILPSGVYEGGYVCAQGTTALRLTVRDAVGGRQTARFDFGGNDGLPIGAYLVAVESDGDDGVVLTPMRWINRPQDYEMVGARLRRNGAELTGSISDPACGNVALRRAD